MSSGEIEATILQLFSWDTQTCEELVLCDQPDIVRIHSLNSNTASDGIDDYVDHAVGDDNDTPFPIIICDGCIDIDGYNNVFASSTRGKDDYGERDGNGTMRYGVDIALKRKFDSIASTMCTETRLDRAILNDDIRRGYHEGISGEGITLVDGDWGARAEP